MGRGHSIHRSLTFLALACLSFVALLALSLVQYGICGPAEDLVEKARAQIGITVIYDGSYKSLNYPNGDIPLNRGVCTDVVIRALRDALNLDLQQMVHEDMKTNFSKYPTRWGLKRPDTNIDHRRVLNLKTFFQRKGWSLEVTKNAADYRPGDIVACTIPGNLPHIMIVSNNKGRKGIPLIIHNIGAGTQEEDRLFEFDLTGHFRIPSNEDGSS